MQLLTIPEQQVYRVYLNISPKHGDTHPIIGKYNMILIEIFNYF